MSLGSIDSRKKYRIKVKKTFTITQTVDVLGMSKRDAAQSAIFQAEHQPDEYKTTGEESRPIAIEITELK